MEILLVLGCSGCRARIPRLRHDLLALIVHIVSLLLHIVGNKDFRHQNFRTTSNLQLVIKLPLAHLGHLLARTVVRLSLFDNIVALSLLQERFLLDANMIGQRED